MREHVFIIAFLFCTAASLQAQQPAQDIRIHEIFHRAPLSKVLKTFQEKYAVKIAYDPALVQNIVVDLVLTDAALSESLDRIFNKTPLTYSRVGDNWIIIPAPQPIVQAPELLDLKITGRVLAEDTEETLPHAVIRVRGTNLITTTNDDGYYTILHIPSDTCLLTVSYVGFITRGIRVSEIGDPLRGDVRLKSDTQILNEVVLVDEYNQAIQIQELPGAFAFNPKSLNSLPSLGEQDISRTMQLMPGISATDESSSGMVIRAMHPNNNLVLLDGMTIYQQDHFFGALSIINTDIIKDVRVNKGMFDARYGGRVSGVIDITSRNGSAVKPAYNVRLNFLNLKATAEIPLAKKWSLFVGARRSITDVVQTGLYDDLFEIARASNDQIQFFQFDPTGEEGGSEPEYAYYDANTKFTFRPTSHDVLSLSLYGSRDRMEIGDEVEFDDGTTHFYYLDKELTRWGNNGASLRWGRQWNEKLYTNSRVSASKFFRNYDFDQNVTIDTLGSAYSFLIRNSISDLSLSIENELLLNDRMSLDFGVSGVGQKTDVGIMDEDHTFGFDPEEDTTEDPDTAQVADSWLTTIYGSVNANLSPKFSVTVGARLNHYQKDNADFYFEPRATLLYRLHEQLNLKAAYGRSNQFVNQMIVFQENGAVSGINEQFWMLSDPEFGYPVITTDHLSAGATVKTDDFVYDAELYYKAGTGVIIDEYFNSANTSMYGLDVMLQKTTGVHKGWIAYSLARATQSHPFLMDGKTVPTLQDQRHELKIVDMLMLGNWNLSSTFVFGSGKPYPKYDVVYHYDNDGYITEYDVFLDYSNQSRLPAYYRLDLAASYKFALHKRANCEIGLSIYNVTGHKNIKTRRLDQSALDEAIFTNVEVEPTYVDVELLGFTPNLFVNISF